MIAIGGDSIDGVTALSNVTNSDIRQLLGLANATLLFDLNGNEIVDEGETQVTSDENGFYSFIEESFTDLGRLASLPKSVKDSSMKL